MYLIFIFAVVLTAVGGCASLKVETSEELPGVDDKVKVILAPNAVYEACRELSSNQLIKFAFEASRPVFFEIHAHGRETEPLVKEESSTSGQGSLPVNTKATYCGSWQNSHPYPVGLEYVFITISK